MINHVTECGVTRRGWITYYRPVREQNTRHLGFIFSESAHPHHLSPHPRDLASAPHTAVRRGTVIRHLPVLSTVDSSHKLPNQACENNRSHLSWVHTGPTKVLFPVRLSLRCIREQDLLCLSSDFSPSFTIFYCPPSRSRRRSPLSTRLVGLLETLA